MCMRSMALSCFSVTDFSCASQSSNAFFVRSDDSRSAVYWSVIRFSLSSSRRSSVSHLLISLVNLVFVLCSWHICSVFSFNSSFSCVLSEADNCSLLFSFWCSKFCHSVRLTVSPFNNRNCVRGNEWNNWKVLLSQIELDYLIRVISAYARRLEISDVILQVPYVQHQRFVLTFQTFVLLLYIFNFVVGTFNLRENGYSQWKQSHSISQGVTFKFELISFFCIVSSLSCIAWRICWICAINSFTLFPCRSWPPLSVSSTASNDTVLSVTLCLSSIGLSPANRLVNCW